MVAGQFEPHSLFDLGFDNITSLLTNMHKRLAILVGTTTPNNGPPTPSMTTPSLDSLMALQDFDSLPAVRPRVDPSTGTQRHPPLP